MPSLTMSTKPKHCEMVTSEHYASTPKHDQLADNEVGVDHPASPECLQDEYFSDCETEDYKVHFDEQKPITLLLCHHTCNTATFVRHTYMFSCEIQPSSASIQINVTLLSVYHTDLTITNTTQDANIFQTLNEFTSLSSASTSVILSLVGINERTYSAFRINSSLCVEEGWVLHENIHVSHRRSCLASVVAEYQEFCLERGHAVSIVSSCGREEGGQQFRLNASALAQLLESAGAGARPVVVVSVAGAYRGGKSFLLDFMLRYLYAQASEGSAGEDWLGGEEEPLRGFSWRGGSERETTGIVLWSQPFPVTLPTGEKVVVLLMDTQGSFDDQSSLRDCSLIFALSTLLSSVQIYNISQKIKEDDLQHLQLFTEYAAQGGGGLAALRLLLRDWSAPYEFPYGAAGGDRYLRHKLQVKDEQPQELREIRQRLAASFVDMSCFLLPHPGLQAAADQSFQGKLSELTDEFKQSLRELMPLVLAPEKLRVKTVGGRALTARELPLFLQVYLEEFNTRVPSPLSVLSATCRVAWVCGREAARACVRAAAPTRALPRAELRARLAAAARDALQPLSPLAHRANDLQGLANLEEELEALVDQYAEINDRRMDCAIAKVKDSFEGVVRELEREGLCLNPQDLSATIAEARDAAMMYFDCDDESAAADPELVQLAKDLEERSSVVLKRLSVVNAANNSLAVEAACALLERALPRGAAHAADLAAAHAAARAAVAQAFYQRRDKPTTQEHDEYVTQLEHDIDFYLGLHKSQNDINNRNAKNEALCIYETSITFNNGYWRPDLLANRHEEVQDLALESFYGSREGPNSRKRDEFVMQIESELLDRYDCLRETNERMNKSAVDEAYARFCKNMDDLCTGLRYEDSDLKIQLQYACIEGKYEFMSKRVNGRTEFDDEEEDLYLQLLLEKMREKFEYYRRKNIRNLSGLEVTGVVIGSIAVLGGLAVGGAGLVAAAAASGPAAAAAATEAGVTAALPTILGSATVLFNLIRRPFFM